MNEYTLNNNNRNGMCYHCGKVKISDSKWPFCADCLAKIEHDLIQQQEHHQKKNDE
jgi:hypothetical protein